MESESFLTTEEFLAIFENCYEWPETKLKGLIQCRDISMKLSDLEKFKEQMKENDQKE